MRNKKNRSEKEVKNKRIILYFLIGLLLTQSNISSQAQENGSSSVDFQTELQQLEAQISDSLSLDKIVKRIEETGRQPSLSLQYIAFYESIIEKHPAIPNNKNHVIILKGSRYNSLAWNSKNTNAELALRYIDTSQYYFDQINLERGTWQNQYGIGVIHRLNGEINEALEYFNRYLEHHTNPYDSVRVSNVKYQIGACFSQLGQWEKAVAALTDAARLDGALGRLSAQANNLNVLASIYKKAGLNDKAVEKYEAAYSIFESIGNKSGMSRSLMNHANLKTKLGQLDAAKTMYQRSIQLDESENNEYAMGYSYENMGNWYLQSEQYDSALYFLDRSYSLRKKHDNVLELAHIERSIGQAHLKMGNLAQSLPYLQRSYKEAKKQGAQENLKEVTRDLSEWYQRKGDYRQALFFKDVFIAAKDSLLNEDIAKQVSEIETQYETEKKEQEIVLLNTKNELAATQLASSQKQNIGLGIGLGLLGLLSLFLFSAWRKIGNQNHIIKKALGEKEILLKEIHHRVKNNLQIISSLLRIQSRSITDTKAKEAIKEGRSRVRSMALIHEDLYKEDNYSGIQMQNYLGNLVKDIFKVYNVGSEKIKLEVDIDPLQLDVDSVIPLGLIINELITNALKHAFNEPASPSGRSEIGKIKLSLKEDGNHLSLSVSDNGKGYTPSSSDSSFGLTMIETFKEKLEAELEIIGDLGTTVLLKIYNYQKNNQSISKTQIV